MVNFYFFFQNRSLTIKKQLLILDFKATFCADFTFTS